MDPNTLERLQEFEKDKKFYDALQFYRTKVTRSFRLKNANEVAVPLVQHALDFFFREKQYQCAIDIATQYTECLSKNNADLDEEVFRVIAESVAKFDSLADYEDGNETQGQLLVAARSKCVDLAIQWTKQKVTSPQEKKYGSANFHGHLAKAFTREKNMELARTHFLLSDDAAAFAVFLKERKENYELTIVEAVLQTLCLDRFPFAVALFNAYTAPAKLPFDLPILNFQHILFDVIETENKAQLAELTEAYKPELMRRPTFIGYLMRIGKLYFGIADKQDMNLGLGGMLNSILGMQKEQETATSHITDRTPPRQKPVAAAAPPSFMPPFFAPPTAPIAAAPPPPAPEEVEEDLD